MNRTLILSRCHAGCLRRKMARKRRRENLMQVQRIGELLRKMVRLSELDVEEILQEQAATHRKFGEIALTLGMCQPEHVWNAWYNQLSENNPLIDLKDFGVDSQAVAVVPKDLAIKFDLIPVRVSGDRLVLAASQLPARADR